MKALRDPQCLLGAGLAAIRDQFRVPADFPPDVLAAAESAARRAPTAHADWTDRAFVTLDPARSTDLDQAFAIEPAGADLLLHYAIADVPWFVDEGGPIDLEAWKRGVTLYLPDGRSAPVCVVKVSRSAPDRRLLPSWTWPEHLVGGGFPIISTTQGQDNVASVGALVTDGRTVFALTSRHVAGPKGSPVSTLVGGRSVEIGVSSERQITRKPFEEVYPEFTARRTCLTLDAGLIERTLAERRDGLLDPHGVPMTVRTSMSSGKNGRSSARFR